MCIYACVSVYGCVCCVCVYVSALCVCVVCVCVYECVCAQCVSMCVHIYVCVYDYALCDNVYVCVCKWVLLLAKGYLVAPQDAMRTVVVNRVPGHLDLKGRQCRGVDARWCHCGLWRQEGEARRREDEGAREEGRVKAGHGP